jgi:hypothetical protein
MLDSHIRTLIPCLDKSEHFEQGVGKWQVPSSPPITLTPSKHVLGQDAKGSPMDLSIWLEKEYLGDAELWVVKVEDLTAGNEVLINVDSSGTIVAASSCFTYCLLVAYPPPS